LTTTRAADEVTRRRPHGTNRSRTHDLVTAIAVERRRWEQASLTDYRRAALQAEVVDLLRIKAQQGAATKGRQVAELLAIEARPADETDELELLADDVKAKPWDYVVVRARWRTSEITPDSDGRRTVVIPVPYPGRPRGVNGERPG
jgi:hypothetical protein